MSSDYRQRAETLVKAFTELDERLAEEMYKAMRKDVLKRNALPFIADSPEQEVFSEEQLTLADAIAERLVYDGEYDWTISEWNNILNHLDEITTADMEPDVILT